jgi:hypothetical protein
MKIPIKSRDENPERFQFNVIAIFNTKKAKRLMKYNLGSF